MEGVKMEKKNLLIGGLLLAGAAFLFMNKQAPAQDAGGDFGSPAAGGWIDTGAGGDSGGSSVPIFNFSPTPDKIAPVQEGGATLSSKKAENAGIISVGAFDISALQQSPLNLNMGQQVKELTDFGKASGSPAQPFLIGTGYTATGAAVPVGAKEQGSKGSGVYGLYTPIESYMAANSISGGSSGGGAVPAKKEAAKEAAKPAFTVGSPVYVPSPIKPATLKK